MFHNATVTSSHNSWGPSMKSTFAAIVFRGRDLLFNLETNHPKIITVYPMKSIKQPDWPPICLEIRTMSPTTRWNPTNNMFSGPRLFSYTKYIKKTQYPPIIQSECDLQNKRTSSRCPKRDAWQRRGYGVLLLVGTILQKLRT